MVEAVVTGVTFTGDADADPRELHDAAALKPGDPLTRGRVQRSLRALYRTGRYETVSAWAVPEGKGVRLDFHLAPLKRVGGLRFSGNTLLSETALGQASGLAIGADWHGERAARAVLAIRAAYHRLGYRQAAVDVEAQTLPGNEVLAAFSIEEGKPTRVAALRIKEPVRDGHAFGGPGQGGRAGAQATSAGNGNGNGSAPAALAPGEADEIIGLLPGAVLDLEELDRGLRRLKERLRTLGRYRAHVGEPQIDLDAVTGGARITLVVDPGPVVRFDFRGNRTFTDTVLRARLAYTGEDPLDEGGLVDLAGRLRTFYLEAGFLNAKVTPREFPESPSDGAHGDTRLLVVFTVEEGKPVRVESLRFEGNAFVSSDKLLFRLESKLADRIEPDPTGGTDPSLVEASGIAGRPQGAGDRPHFRVQPSLVYSPSLYRQAIAGIVDLYKSYGFLDAAVDPPRVIELDGPGSARLDVAIVVHEGPRTMVEGLQIRGNKEVGQEEVRRVVRLAPGDPFSYLQVEEVRGAIAALYARLGWLFARIEEETLFSDAPDGGKRAAVRYQITEGPQVRTGHVILKGLRRTQAFVVLDALGLKEGEVLTSERIAQAQGALQRLGIFSSATLRLSDPEMPEALKDVVVQVRERPPTAWELSLGLSTTDGPRALVQYGEHNLGGRNVNFNGAAKVNFPVLRAYEEGFLPIEGRLDLGLQYPRIYGLPFPLGGRADLALQRALRPRYFLQKAGAVAGLDYHATRELAMALQYEIEFDQFQIVGAAEAAQQISSSASERRNLLLPEGNMVLGSLRPSVALDLRDDPGRPRSGIYASLSADYVRSFFAEEPSGADFTVDIVKVAGQASAYLSLPALRSVVLALSVSGGTIFTLSPPEKRPLTPAHKRFFLGGAGSLRGFSEDAVVPQDERLRLAGEVDACQAVPHFCPEELGRVALLGEPAPSAGGQSYMVGKAELRVPVPLFETLELAAFLDIGNLWLDPSQVRLFFTDATGAFSTGLRWTVGGGLRWITPIGPLALDLGVLIDRDDRIHEKTFSLHFSIGLF